MDIISISYARTTARTIINYVKGSSYINKDGVSVPLVEKADVSNAKKASRDALSVYMRTTVPQARQQLTSLATKFPDEKVVFTTKEWEEFTVLMSSELDMIITQIAASARSGKTVEGLIILAFEEVAQLKLKERKE